MKMDENNFIECHSKVKMFWGYKGELGGLNASQALYIHNI